MKVLRTFCAIAVAVTMAQAYGPEKYEECDLSRDCAESCVTIFQERNYGGWKQCVPLPRELDCLNLGDWWQAGSGRVSSFNAHNSCVRFYDRKDCQGFSYTATNKNEDLSEIGWEDVTKSVGHCGEKSHRCSLENLFSTLVLEEAVSKGAEDVAKAVRTAIAGSVGGFFPVANVAFNVLQLVETVASGGDPYPAMIAAKVEEGIARNAAVQIKAKMGIVENWLRTMSIGNTSESDLKIEILIALHTCEELFLLFQDSNYAFSSNKVLSSPYLVAFSNVYFGLANIMYELRTDLRTKLRKDIANLAELNEEYLKKAKKQRKAQIEAKEVGHCGTYSQAAGLPCGPKIIDNLVSKEFDLCDLLNGSSCHPTGDLGTYKRCAWEIKESIDDKLDKFFIPTIQQLKNFRA